MTSPRLELTREQILAYRRSANALDEKLPPGPPSLRRAAWAGLQDSMPRAAALSIHARVGGAEPNTWADPSLVQVWGPRFSAYVIAADDLAVFTLGRFPDDTRGRSVAEDLAERIDTFLAGREMRYDEAAQGIGEKVANRLRYATTTGRVLIRWDGARQPTIRTVAAPHVEPDEARLELARRYLRVFGPGTPGAFAQWAGIGPAAGQKAFDVLGRALVAVRTPVGDAWILSRDESEFGMPASAAAPARLLPSGDAYFLLQGADRELLVPDPTRRRLLWTPRVWPGAVLVDGEIVGTWRRAGPDVAIGSWRRLSRPERTAVETEAAGMPLPGLGRTVQVSWLD
jgi:hypothetical protein